MKALLMGKLKQELDWLLGDAIALVCMIVLVPLVPMFALFDEIRSIHDEERDDVSSG